jgi:guanylate kinase
MNAKAVGRLVILSGPSCVGKSPLDKALAKFYPQLRRRLRKLVLYNSRAPRPGETEGVDYHFRTRDQVEALRTESRYAVLVVRGDLQAVDMDELRAQLEDSGGFLRGILSWVERCKCIPAWPVLDG